MRGWTDARISYDAAHQREDTFVDAFRGAGSAAIFASVAEQMAGL